jgi:hypothetical protein
MGFWMDEGSYLRDTWNLLDFLVVCTSILALFPDQSNVSSLRVIRMLRPLKSIQKFEGNMN